MLLIIILLVIWGAAVACLWNRGIWAAALTLVNLVFSALIAMNYFEPLAQKLGDKNSNMMDFICLWLIFGVIFAVLRLATDLLSRTKVRFPYSFDVIGAVVLALVCGWITFCFLTASLHVSPLARTSLFGSFMDAPDQEMIGIGPDRMWLAFTRHASLGAFSNSDEGFDPSGEFVFKYAARRQAAYEAAKKKANNK